MKLRYSMIVALLLCFGAKTVIAAIQFELLDRNTVLARLLFSESTEQKAGPAC